MEVTFGDDEEKDKNVVCVLSGLAVESTRFFHSVFSNGSRVHALLKSRAGSN